MFAEQAGEFLQVRNARIQTRLGPCRERGARGADGGVNGCGRRGVTLPNGFLRDGIVRGKWRAIARDPVTGYIVANMLIHDISVDH